MLFLDTAHLLPILALHEVEMIEDLFLERKKVLGKALAKIESATQVIEVGTTLADTAPKKKEAKTKPAVETENAESTW